MSVFRQILWMIVTIRLLGKQPKLPSCHESLVEYAAVLEIQYSRICANVGVARHRESAVMARGIVRLLGLIEAAEPLPSLLLVLRERHESQRSGQLPFHRPTPGACLSRAEAPIAHSVTGGLTSVVDIHEI